MSEAQKLAAEIQAAEKKLKGLYKRQRVLRAKTKLVEAREKDEQEDNRCAEGLVMLREVLSGKSLRCSAEGKGTNVNMARHSIWRAWIKYYPCHYARYGCSTGILKRLRENPPEEGGGAELLDRSRLP